MIDGGPRKSAAQISPTKNDTTETLNLSRRERSNSNYFLMSNLCWVTRGEWVSVLGPQIHRERVPNDVKTNSGNKESKLPIRVLRR